MSGNAETRHRSTVSLIIVRDFDKSRPLLGLPSSRVLSSLPRKLNPAKLYEPSDIVCRNACQDDGL